jgi:hypothetical protein
MWIRWEEGYLKGGDAVLFLVAILKKLLGI